MTARLGPTIVGSARAVLACVMALAPVACVDNFRPRNHPADGGDADADGLDDGDADPDAPDGDVVDPDGDADGDEPAVPARIVGLTVTALEDGSYPAGTSVLLEVEPTWDGEPTGGVEVELRAGGGGLLSLPPQHADQPSATLRTEAGGGLPLLRLTFTLEPWPREVTLVWTGESGTEQPVDGSADYTVVAPEIVEVVLEGATDETATLPRGLRAEQYALVGGALSYREFGGTWNHNMALEHTTGSWGSNLAVVTRFQTCLFQVDLVPGCFDTAPEVPAAEGPDNVLDAAFLSGDPTTSGLYLVSYAFAGSEAGGLYVANRDGLVTRLADQIQTNGLVAVGSDNRFRPVDGPGVYWAAYGSLRHYAPALGESVTICEDAGIWPKDLAVAEPDIYGHIMFFTRGSDDVGVLERLEPSCGHEPVADLDSDRVMLEASPGAVFGRMVYSVHALRVGLLVPAVDGIELIELLRTSAPRQLRSLVFVPALPGEEAHPPGMYVLDGQVDDGRLLRVYQDLSEP